MSAKFRLTAWIALMMILMFSASMVLLTVTDKHIVTKDPEGRIVDVVWHNARDVEYDNMRFDWDDLDYHRQGVYCSVYDASGDFLQGAIPDGFSTAGVPLSGGALRTIEQGGEEYYVYDLCWDMDVTSLWIRGVAAASENYSSMDTIITLAVTILPGILALGILGGWLISRSTFRPINEIIEKAASITGGDDLTARIDLKHGPREMRRLAKGFDGMFERLEDAFESEKQFVSDASHELRTPTTVILAECASARKKAKTKEDFDRSLTVIEEQGNKMSHMIGQLLSITRLEQGTERIRMKTVDMSAFTHSCCEEFIPKADRGITLGSDIQPSVTAQVDLGLMSRVIQNLLENAYKYGRENGHITVSLYNDNGAVLRVTDDGIGIAPEDLPNIWRRFWQADSSRGEDEGVGLGLAMVKQICEFHGGSVTAESEPGKGSTFTVKLPPAPAE